VILRCTAKALRLLGSDGTAVHRDLVPGPDDWYLNLLWVRRRKCLLLVHAGTLFPVFTWDVRVRDLRPLGRYVASQVEAALQEEDLPRDRLGDLASQPWLIATTADRRVLGFMNDMARSVHYWAAEGTSSSFAVDAISRELRRGLHNRGGTYVSPINLVREWDGPPGGARW
jgi:hypothetical protein